MCHVRPPRAGPPRAHSLGVRFYSELPAERDCNPTGIEYERERREAGAGRSVTKRIMDARQQLAFPDSSFDPMVMHLIHPGGGLLRGGQNCRNGFLIVLTVADVLFAQLTVVGRDSLAIVRFRSSSSGLRGLGLRARDSGKRRTPASFRSG